MASSTISHSEKNISVRYWRVDQTANTLLERIRGLLAARPELDRQDFGRAIKRETPSWLSEFFSGKRTTNDLRLVIRMARFFGVTVGHLLNETGRSEDADTTTLMAAWDHITDKRDRQALLNLALMLRGRDDEGGSAQSDGPASGPRSGAGTNRGLKRRR